RASGVRGLRSPTTSRLHALGQHLQSRQSHAFRITAAENGQILARFHSKACARPLVEPARCRLEIVYGEDEFGFLAVDTRRRSSQQAFAKLDLLLQLRPALIARFQRVVLEAIVKVRMQQ